MLKAVVSEAFHRWKCGRYQGRPFVPDCNGGHRWQDFHTTRYRPIIRIAVCLECGKLSWPTRQNAVERRVGTRAAVRVQPLRKMVNPCEQHPDAYMCEHPDAYMCDCTADDFCLHRPTPYDNGETSATGLEPVTWGLTMTCVIILVVCAVAIIFSHHHA